MPIHQTKNNIDIYYEIVNTTEETTETILLIGGLTRAHSVWRKLFPFLQESYNLILPDNRDAGRSTSECSWYTTMDLANDMADLLSSLITKPIHVVGHSLGGFMAMHLASQHPEFIKTLTLCGTVAKQIPPGIEYLNTRIQLATKAKNSSPSSIKRENIMAVMPYLYAQNSLENIGFVEEIIEFELSNPHPQSIDSFIRQAQACLTHDAILPLKNITCPTFVIAGEYDRIFSPEEVFAITQYIPHAEKATLSTGHMIQLEQPEVLFQHLDRFIQQHSN